jgi:hypothetical protein
MCSVAVDGRRRIGVPLGIALGRWLCVLFANEICAAPTLSLVCIDLGALVLANVVAGLPGKYAARTSPAPAAPTERLGCSPFGAGSGRARQAAEQCVRLAPVAQSMNISSSRNVNEVFSTTGLSAGSLRAGCQGGASRDRPPWHVTDREIRHFRRAHAIRAAGPPGRRARREYAAGQCRSC